MIARQPVNQWVRETIEAATGVRWGIAQLPESASLPCGVVSPVLGGASQVSACRRVGSVSLSFQIDSIDERSLGAQELADSARAAIDTVPLPVALPSGVKVVGVSWSFGGAGRRDGDPRSLWTVTDTLSVEVYA